MKKNTRSVSIIIFIVFLILGLLLSTIVLMSFNRFIVKRSIIILAIIIYLTLLAVVVFVGRRNEK